MDNTQIEAITQFLQAILPCISTLVWQIIIAVALIYFRVEIMALIDRVASLKVGDWEVAFQPIAPEATSPGGEAETELEMLGPGGFFTREGIAQLIQKSGLIEPGERVEDSLQIFQTKKQHTWLITTNGHMFCVLDDENTRDSGKLIQWRITLEQAEPITVIAHKPTVGLVSIGPRKNWLYSRSLHANPDELKREIEAMVAKGKEMRSR